MVPTENTFATLISVEGNQWHYHVDPPPIDVLLVAPHRLNNELIRLFDQ